MKTYRNNLFSISSIFILALVASTLSFCSCKSESKPQEPVMDEASFASFLEEAFLLEGYYSLETHYRFDTLQPQMIASYDTLMAKYGITHDDLDTTIHWYVRHPDIYLRVQESVMARLTPVSDTTAATLL